MPALVSRRKLARYAADQLLEGDANILEAVAALLVAEKRQREVDLLVRDVQAALAERGLTVATVESAHALTPEARRAITQLFSGEVHVSEVVNPKLLGGLKITTPTQELDATLLKKLTDLRTRRV